LQLIKINPLLKNIDNNLLNINNNYYNYYIQYNLLEKYNKILYTSFINITNRIKDIKFDFINIKTNTLFL
jgi:hypothetical protein